jgi:hypothetical protein
MRKAQCTGFLGDYAARTAQQQDITRGRQLRSQLCSELCMLLCGVRWMTQKIVWDRLADCMVLCKCVFALRMKRSLRRVQTWETRSVRVRRSTLRASKPYLSRSSRERCPSPHGSPANVAYPSMTHILTKDFHRKRGTNK